MKLTEAQLNDTISEYMTDNSWLNLTQEEISRTKKIYHLLENENNMIQKTLDETKSAVTGIINDIINSRSNPQVTDTVMYNRFSDNKHMNYFDIFLQEGERGNITEALQGYNIPTEVLKPIRKMTDYTSTPEFINGQYVQIIQETEKDDDGYVYVSYFAILVDGEPIYQFRANKNIMSENMRKNFLETAQNMFDEGFEEFNIGETIKSRKVTTPDYSYVEETFANKEGDVKTRRRYAKGTIIDGVKVGGRFIKK